MAAPPPSLISVAAQLQHVQMTFDGFASLALVDVNLEIRRGEIFGVIGPEGSGKSTLLMLLAGQLRPADGKVRVFGHSPRRSSIRARIGYLPQLSRRPNRTGLFGLLGRVVQRFQPAAEPSAVAIPTGLRMDQLLLKKPELLVLDEPFAGLDAAGILAMKDRIGALARQGKTVILSDRCLAPAKDVCARMAILSRGQIQAIGSMPQLLALPDAIRIIGPVLPPASTERVLRVVREEMSIPSTESLHPPDGAPGSATAENSIFTALTRPGPAKLEDAPLSALADTVDHEKLAQLTKLGSEVTKDT